MADMQNLVERLERAVGRLEAVSHASAMHCGNGDSAAKGKQYMQPSRILGMKTQCLGLEFFSHSVFSPLKLTSEKRLI